MVAHATVSPSILLHRYAQNRLMWQARGIEKKGEVRVQSPVHINMKQ